MPPHVDHHVAGRVAVIGDVGGHLGQLQAELRRLGADERTGRLPDDLTVVQVGDLIHRGPHSEGVVALVDSYLTRQPHQWTQLVGNHEAQYVSEPVFVWPTRIESDAADRLRHWWASGQMCGAAALDVDGEQFLITHAGLTAHYWRDVLGSPTTAQACAAAINALIGSYEQILFSAGHVLGGGPPNLSAGPIWASAASELLRSWIDVPLPFSQIHGHSSIVDWDQGGRVPTTSDLHQRSTTSASLTIDVEAKHEIVELPGGRLIGVDPGHGRTPRPAWRALEFSC